MGKIRQKTHHCPNCNYELSAATPVEEGKTPSSGDVSICAICESILIYDEDLISQNPTQEQIDQLKESELWPKLATFGYTLKGKTSPTALGKEALILGKQEFEALRKLKEYAHANPFTMDNMLNAFNNPSEGPGLKPEYQTGLPIGFKVVFTIDEYPEHKVRHLSMSRDKKGIVPSPAAVQMIMKLLDFKNELVDCDISFEKLEPGYEAINICELI